MKNKSKATELQRRMKPKNDFVFQKLFGEEESKESLIGLLNALLGFVRRQEQELAADRRI